MASRQDCGYFLKSVIDVEGLRPKWVVPLQAVSPEVYRTSSWVNQGGKVYQSSSMDSASAVAPGSSPNRVSALISLNDGVLPESVRWNKAFPSQVSLTLRIFITVVEILIKTHGK